MYVIERSDGRTDGLEWAENHQGARYGAGISLILESTETVGDGPRLHKHPYPETFVIRSGRALFTAGDQERECHAGQIVIVPADTPHKFRNLGPDRLESVNIHEGGEFATEWLE